MAGLIIYYFRSKQKRESEFSSALVNRLEEERGRIARDLHDGIGQSLIILKNKFNKIEGGAEGLSEELNENFSDTIEEVRSISRSLIPPELSRLGLKKSLNKMLKDVEFSAGIVVSIDINDLDAIELEQPAEIRIYRIIQESINNLVKHSQAQGASIEICKEEHFIRASIKDNGIGFNPVNREKTTHSLEMKTLFERTKIIHSKLFIESKPGQGTKVKLLTPITI